jgi:4-hydroxy-3-polyprenylbenzoate decarboxylase
LDKSYSARTATEHPDATVRRGVPVGKPSAADGLEGGHVSQSAPRRVIVGITGASGAVYGIRLLQRLSGLPDVESHLVVTRGGVLTIQQETAFDVPDVLALADVVHPVANIGASIASGSFPTAGMVVAPCSMRTVGAIANSLADNLVVRAADVTLKEGRPLILMVRESPLHRGHLRLMSLAAEAGAIIAPPVPAFYHRPTSLEEVVDHTVSRTLDRLGVEHGATVPWLGLMSTAVRNCAATEVSAPSGDLDPRGPRES